MVYTRNMKRKATLRKRTYKKRPMNISRPRRRMPGAKLVFKRKQWVGNWVPNTTTVTGFWRQFNYTFGSMSNASEFTSLFDQYKINAMKITLMPKYDNFSGNDTTDTTLPGVTNQGGVYVHVINDPYATNNITGTYGSSTLNSLLENGKVRSYQGNKPINIYYKPTIQGSVENQYLQMFTKSRYLPTTQSGITHFGPQVFVQDQNFTGVFGQSFDIFVTWYATFKNMK